MGRVYVADSIDMDVVADALFFANTAASICVQRMGAAPSMPTAEEVGAAPAASRLT